MPDIGLLIAIFAGFTMTSWLAGYAARREAPRSASRFVAIDGLRGYLALAVVAHHFVIWRAIVETGRPWSAPESHWQNQLGAGAVALFFMTTGFLFFPIVKNGANATNWPAFFIKRCFRIIPPTLVSVALVALLIAIEYRNFPSRSFFKEVIFWVTGWSEATLLGIPEAGRANAFVLWSLWYEWVFYLLLLPLFSTVSWCARGRLPDWLLPVIVIAGAFAMQIAGRSNPIWHYLPLFGAGMLVRVLSRIPQVRQMCEHPAMAIVALTVLAIGMVSMAWPYFAALPFFALFFLTVACGNTLFGVLSAPGAQALGEASFGIYLLHGVILYAGFHGFAADHVTVGHLATLPLFMMVTAMLAMTMFHWIERPAIALGAKLAEKAGRSRHPLTVESIR